MKLAHAYFKCVGLDPDTGIYGIRFNLIDPFTNFTICFRTLPVEPVNQTLGLIADGNVFNDQMICSPGCRYLPCKCGNCI